MLQSFSRLHDTFVRRGGPVFLDLIVGDGLGF